MKGVISYFGAFVIAAMAAIAGADVAVPPTPAGHVVDLAGVIPADKAQQIVEVLRELEARTSVQVVVLTVPALGDETIDRFSLRVAETWRLGQKGKDNGLLVTVAPRERQYRFEVGYGLEPVLTDSVVSSLGREVLVPAFEVGDYGSGILEAARAISLRLGSVEPLRSPGPVEKAINIAVVGGAAVAMVALVIFNIRKRRARCPDRPQPGGATGADPGTSSERDSSSSDPPSYSGGGGTFGGGGSTGRW